MKNDKTPVDIDFVEAAVPHYARRGIVTMFMIMLGFTFFSASMWVGKELADGLDFGGFIASLIIGGLILSLYTGLLGYVGAETGMSLDLLARKAFGSKGSYLPSAMISFTQIGWFGVGIAMFADPVQAFLKGSGYNCNIWIPIIIAGVLMTASAYWGIKALTIVSVIAVPAIAIGGGFSAIKVFVDNPDAWNTLHTFTPDQGKALTLSAAIALTVGSFISGGTCTPDFVRFAKTRKTAVITTAIAFFAGNTLMFLFGAVGGMFYDTNDISVVLVKQGLLIPGIIVLGLNIWTTNDNALYTSGLGLSNITGLPKRYIVLFNGLLGTVLALYLYNNFCGYLSMLNTFIPPVGAVLAADFFVIRKCGKNYEPLDELKNASKISFAAVIAWAAGGAVAFFTTNWGISAINGMLTSAVVYIVLKKLFPKA